MAAIASTGAVGHCPVVAELVALVVLAEREELEA
jgi:hypothetical protein